MKTCKLCEISKPYSDFSKRAAMRDGYRSECKDCINARSREWHQENKERANKKTLEWQRNNPEKVRAKAKRYRESNLDKCRERGRDHYARNRDAYIARAKQWRKENQDKYDSYNKEYRESNAGKFAAYAAGRLAAQNQRTPPWADKEKIEEIYELAELATDDTGEEHQVDHIIPLQGKTVSGLHVHDNLQVITAEENRKKSNKFG